MNDYRYRPYRGVYWPECIICITPELLFRLDYQARLMVYDNLYDGDLVRSYQIIEALDEYIGAIEGNWLCVKHRGIKKGRKPWRGLWYWWHRLWWP